MSSKPEITRVFEGRALQCIRFPLGGSGAVSLIGRGGLEDWRIDGQPRFGPLPRSFAAVFAHAAGRPPVARVLEARPMPTCAGSSGEPGQGLPHMASARFRGEFPFAEVEFDDPALPLRVRLEAFSPFAPGEPEVSEIPCAVLRYTLLNTGDERARVSVAWSLLNIAGGANTYVDEEGVRGLLFGDGTNSVALLTPQRGVIFTTHWLRGPDTTAMREFWNTFAATGYVPYHDYGSSRATQPDAGAVGVRLSVRPAESKTVVFYFTWHFPAVRPSRAGKTQDALALAQILHARLGKFEERTRLFHDAIFSTTAPPEFLEPISASFAAPTGTLSNSAVPGERCGGPPSSDCPSPDTNLLASIIRTYREWKLSGDEVRLSSAWPHIKNQLLSLSERVDPGKHGLPSRPVTVAEGVQIPGASPLPAFLYLGALAAGAELADYMGDSDAAGSWREIYDRGLEAAERRLWKSSLYVQAPDNEEHADHDLTGACLSTALLGEWLCELAGLGHLAQPRRVRKALETMVKTNWRADLAGHPNPGRAFAREGEPGLLMCTFPRGARPGSAPPWSDEVWTSVEYMIASHCIYAELVDEAVRIVRGVQARYDGEKRNPWSDAECAYWLLPALSGFYCDRGAGSLGFAPRLPAPFRCFWSLNGAWGTYEQAETTAALRVLHGKLILNRLDLPNILDQTPWNMTVLNRHRIVHPDEFGSITFRRALTLNAGQQLLLQK